MSVTSSSGGVPGSLLRFCLVIYSVRLVFPLINFQAVRCQEIHYSINFLLDLDLIVHPVVTFRDILAVIGKHCHVPTLMTVFAKQSLSVIMSTMTMQTALSMYKEDILCFLMEKVDILGTAP